MVQQPAWLGRGLAFLIQQFPSQGEFTPSANATPLCKLGHGPVTVGRSQLDLALAAGLSDVDCRLHHVATAPLEAAV